MPRLSNKLLILLVIIAVVVGARQYLLPASFESETLYIQSDTRLWPFTVEIAKTKKQQEKGLMLRRHMKENSGMLFEFSEPKRAGMWMKNTLIPLDILFIDEYGNVVFIAENARPRSLNTISYDKPVLAVLEIPGGTVKTRMLKVGDIVIHPFFEHTGHLK